MVQLLLFFIALIPYIIFFLIMALCLCIQKLLIPVTIILASINIIARRLSALIYTLLMVGFGYLLNWYLNFRFSGNDEGGSYFLNGEIVLHTLVSLLIVIIIIIFFALTIYSLVTSKRLHNFFNKLGKNINKNVNKVYDYTKKDINNAFNLDKKEEKNEVLEEQQEETQIIEKKPGEIETRTQIIMETENSFNKHK